MITVTRYLFFSFFSLSYIADSLVYFIFCKFREGTSLRRYPTQVQSYFSSVKHCYSDFWTHFSYPHLDSIAYFFNVIWWWSLQLVICNLGKFSVYFFVQITLISAKYNTLLQNIIPRAEHEAMHWNTVPQADHKAVLNEKLQLKRDLVSTCIILIQWTTSCWNYNRCWDCTTFSLKFCL